MIPLQPLLNPVVVLATCLGVALGLLFTAIRARPDRRGVRVSASALAVLGILLMALGPGRYVGHGRQFDVRSESELDSAVLWSDTRDTVFAEKTLAAYDWAHLAGSVEAAWPDESSMVRIERLEYPAGVALGSDVRVDVGAGANAEGSVRLYAQGTAAAEVPLRDGAAVVTHRPPSVGRLDYRIELLNPVDSVLQSGAFGVYVREPVPLRVLMLEAFPGFEANYLRDWIAERGGSVAVRTRISRDRYRTEYMNHDVVSLDRIDGDLVRRFNVLVADAGSLSRLTAGERAAISRSVLEGEAGLVILGPPPPPVPGLPAPPAFLAAGDEDALVRPTFADPGDDGVVGAAGELALDPLTLEIHRDRGGRVVSAVRLSGSGRVVTSTVTESYAWLLRGRQETYDSFWSSVLAEAVAEPSVRWNLAHPGPPVVGRPVLLSLAGAEQPPGVLVRAPTGLFDLQPVVEPLYGATVSFWPDEAGWHLVYGGGDSLWFHVSPRGEWAGVARAHALQASRLAAVWPQRGDGDLPARASYPPRLWWLAFAAAGLALLWLEERL